MDQLKFIFDAKTIPPDERLGIVWEESLGQEAVVAMCQRLFPALRPLRSWDIQGKSGRPHHCIIEGDNYHALAALNMTHQHKIDAIYIDPPYNTGNHRLNYQDNFTGKRSKLRHSRWLSIMYNRLRLTRNLLTEDGVIFISIDDHEMAHLKLLCDGIFGSKNFLGNLIWINRTTPNDAASNFAIDHEYVMVYAKQKENVKFRGAPKDFTRYVNRDNDPHGPWMPDNPSAASGTMRDFYPIENPYTGEKYYPPKGRFWAFSKRRIPEWTASGKLVFYRESGKNFLLKKYLSELKSQTKPASSVITGIFTMQGTKELKQLFHGASPIKYPKPTGLIKYLFNLLDKQTGIFLDFYAGSGTTGQAVIELNRADGGQRCFILCNNNENDLCRSVLYPRIKKVIQGYEIKKIQTEQLFNKKITLTSLHKASSILQQVNGVAALYKKDYDKIKKTFKDNTLMLTGIKQQPTFVQGSEDHLHYFQIQGIAPEDENVEQVCADMLSLKEQVFETAGSKPGLYIYRNEYRQVIISFNKKENAEEMKSILSQTDIPAVIYPFGTEGFDVNQDQVSAVAPPEEILHLYMSRAL